MKRLPAISLFVLLASIIAQGQSQNTKAIVGATLIDGTGRAPIKNAVILIEGERVKAAGPGGSTRVPEGAQVIDARGKFVIPGLADMHNHLNEGSFGPSKSPTDYKRNLSRMLGFGFTLIFAPGIPDLETFAELKKASASDTAPYSRFYSAGVQFRARGEGDGESSFRPETPDEARTAVQDLKRGGVDAVKIIYSDSTYVIKRGRRKLPHEVMAAIIDEAHRRGLKAYVHAPILKYAKEALRAGADGLVHGILSEPIDDEFIEMMKKNRAVYVTTHSIFEAVGDIGGWARRMAAFNDRGLVAKAALDVGLSPDTAKKWEARFDNLAYTRERLPILRANTRRAYESGLLVVAGADTGDAGAGVLLGLASQMELRLIVEAGLSAMQAIQIATINAARMIGREKELGTVEPGKLADLVILDADPLADISNVRRIHRIIKGGVVYDPARLVGRNEGRSD